MTALHIAYQNPQNGRIPTQCSVPAGSHALPCTFPMGFVPVSIPVFLDHRFRVLQPGAWPGTGHFEKASFKFEGGRCFEWPGRPMVLFGNGLRQLLQFLVTQLALSVADECGPLRQFLVGGRLLWTVRSFSETNLTG